MDDYILRETAIKIVKNAESRHDALFALRTIPGLAYVAPVVRCKYCVHYDKGENDSESWSYCKILARDVPEDWFCGDGKMKMRG